MELRVIRIDVATAGLHPVWQDGRSTANPSANARLFEPKPLPVSRSGTPLLSDALVPKEYDAFQSGVCFDSAPQAKGAAEAQPLYMSTSSNYIHRNNVPCEDPEKDALPRPTFQYSSLPQPPDDLATKIYKRSPQPDCYTLVVVGQVRKDSLQFTTVCRMIVLWCGGRVAFGDCLQGPPFNPKRNSGMIRLWVHNEALAAVLDADQKYWLGRRGIYAVDDTVQKFLHEAHEYVRRRCLGALPVTIQIAHVVPGEKRETLASSPTHGRTHAAMTSE